MKPACGVLGRDSGLEDQTEQSHKVGLCVRVTDLVLKLQQACLQGLAGSRARTRILTSSEAVHRAAHLSYCSALALDRARSHPDFERSARLQSGRPTAGEALESVHLRSWPPTSRGCRTSERTADCRQVTPSSPNADIRSHCTSNRRTTTSGRRCTNAGTASARCWTTASE